MSGSMCTYFGLIPPVSLIYNIFQNFLSPFKDHTFTQRSVKRNK